MFRRDVFVVRLLCLTVTGRLRRRTQKSRSCRKTRSKPACTASPTPSSKALTPEPMDVEILGVLRDMAGPKSDVILARLHGKKVEYTGVVAGMSGSPVYIDGKLVGAIAYRIGEFSKEPICRHHSRGLHAGNRRHGQDALPMR